MFGSKNNGTDNVFAKLPADDKDEKQNEEKDDEDSESPVKYGDSQSPSHVLADHPLSNSPFDKIYEVDTDKFKIVKPEKRNCGIGKVSIHKVEFESKD